MQAVSHHPFGQVGLTSRRLRLARWVALGVCVSASVLVATAAPAAAATSYSVTNLGSLGYGVSDGLAINAVGQVTGYSYTSNAFQVSCPPHQYGGSKKCFEHPYHAFFWSNGTMTDLGTLGGHFSKGVAINLSGEVVGTADTTSGSDGFLWNGKKMVDLGAFYPSGINDAGQVAGNCPTGPCVLSNGTFTQLPDPPGLTCSAGPINNNGDVLSGDCGDASSDQLSVVWENGTPIELGTLGGPQTGAAALNNLAQVVGWSQTSTDADHPFLWSGGTMTDLGVSFFPAAINDNGVIVGDSAVYSSGSLQDLNTLTPTGSPQITYANAINDNGQIVADAGSYALVLTPN